jgi:hypothetical protein
MSIKSLSLNALNSFSAILIHLTFPSARDTLRAFNHFALLLPQFHKTRYR